MTPEQWRRARDLFEDAVDRDPADVSRLLERVASSDPDVEREVRSLLFHHMNAGTFLAEPLRDSVPDLLLDGEPLAPGTTVGPYVIVREIGRGGMGRVYLASDARLGRRVALKALPPALAGDAQWRERLRREARAAAALSHPGVCTIYALEEIDGALFIAAEYVEGRTLREEMASGRRPSSLEVVDIARELAEALASAHAKGITHRDLKPENVMRSADGSLKILDFGLARIDDGFAGLPEDGGNGRLTRPGILIGTPAYMAPEQLNGQPADARSDVFAFGVLMYEYTCGVHPFEAPSPLAMAARVLEGDARPIETMRPDMPAGPVAVIDRCLRKSPANRWQSAVDIALALARDEARDEGSPPNTNRVRIWWRSHQLVIMAVYVLASAVAWQIKEWVHGYADAAFVAVGIGAATGGVLRGHLIFTSWINAAELNAEWARAERITLVVDLALAMILALSGALATPTSALAGMLTIALAVAIALARTILEPATTAAALGRRKPS